MTDANTMSIYEEYIRLVYLTKEKDGFSNLLWTLSKNIPHSIYLDKTCIGFGLTSFSQQFEHCLGLLGYSALTSYHQQNVTPAMISTLRTAAAWILLIPKVGLQLLCHIWSLHVRFYIELQIPTKTPYIIIKNILCTFNLGLISL